MCTKRERGGFYETFHEYRQEWLSFEDNGKMVVWPGSWRCIYCLETPNDSVLPEVSRVQANERNERG